MNPQLPIARSVVIALCMLGLTFAFAQQAAATPPAETPIVDVQQEAEPTTPQPAQQGLPDLSGFALLGVGGLMAVVFGLGMLVMTQDEL
jgi:hypothetical protein